MAFKDDLDALKAELAQAGVSEDELVEAAGFHRTTWMRWNNATFRPRFDSWMALRSTADRLLEGRRDRVA